ncbi:hypothetical protein FH972_023858 [Carpinus fangiana]|uniref:Uncharacterized protein n=1 Tax=Carpinus fangiana TaxID=176857 RepID=A0A5N6KWE0_9ROSI|nr:hypothetical protein FH972_023858 [Carpinus fangiana]
MAFRHNAILLRLNHMHFYWTLVGREVGNSVIVIVAEECFRYHALNHPMTDLSSRSKQVAYLHACDDRNASLTISHYVPCSNSFSMIFPPHVLTYKYSLDASPLARSRPPTQDLKTNLDSSAMIWLHFTTLLTLALASTPQDSPKPASNPGCQAVGLSRLLRRADNSAAVISSLKNCTGLNLDQLDALIRGNPTPAAFQKQEQKLESCIKDATDLETSSSVATAQESTDIYNVVNNTVRPKVNTVIDDFISTKGTTFASLKSLVRQDLVNLKNLTQTLGNAIVAKATGTAKTNGPALITQITNKIQSGIDAYS